MKRLRAIAALAWLALPGAQSSPPDSSRVEVSRSAQGALEIHAQAKVDAETVTVWSALTAYEEFPRFVAGLRRSEVVARDGSTATVVQQWRIPLLWFSIPVDVTVKSVERPPDLIEVHLVKGNLKQLDGRYRIERAPAGGLVLHWDGIIEGYNLLPDWLVTPIVRKMALAQFNGMLAEIAQRAAAGSARKPGADMRSKG